MKNKIVIAAMISLSAMLAGCASSTSVGAADSKLSVSSEVVNKSNPGKAEAVYDGITVKSNAWKGVSVDNTYTSQSYIRMTDGTYQYNVWLSGKVEEPEEEEGYTRKDILKQVSSNYSRGCIEDAVLQSSEYNYSKFDSSIDNAKIPSYTIVKYIGDDEIDIGITLIDTTDFSNASKPFVGLSEDITDKEAEAALKKNISAMSKGDRDIFIKSINSNNKAVDNMKSALDKFVDTLEINE